MYSDSFTDRAAVVIAASLLTAKRIKIENQNQRRKGSRDPGKVAAVQDHVGQGVYSMFTKRTGR